MGTHPQVRRCRHCDHRGAAIKLSPLQLPPRFDRDHTAVQSATSLVPEHENNNIVVPQVVMATAIPVAATQTRGA